MAYLGFAIFSCVIGMGVVIGVAISNKNEKDKRDNKS